MGFFAEFNAWLTALLDNYIHQYTVQMAAILEPALVTLGTLYVLIWGFLHIAGRIEEPVLEGLKRIAILALVFGVGLDLWLYDTVIVETFYRAPAALAGRLVGANDFVAIVDTILFRGDDVATALLAKAGVFHGNFSFYFAAIAVYVVIVITAVYTMFLLTLSRIALSILLAIGPLIIPLFLFQSTRRFVEAWFAQLATYAFVAVLAGLVAALMMHLIDQAAAQAQAVGRQHSDRASGSGLYRSRIYLSRHAPGAAHGEWPGERGCALNLRHHQRGARERAPQNLVRCRAIRTRSAHGPGNHPLGSLEPQGRLLALRQGPLRLAPR